MTQDTALAVTNQAMLLVMDTTITLRNIVRVVVAVVDVADLLDQQLGRFDSAGARDKDREVHTVVGGQTAMEMDIDALCKEQMKSCELMGWKAVCEYVTAIYHSH